MSRPIYTAAAGAPRDAGHHAPEGGQPATPRSARPLPGTRGPLQPRAAPDVSALAPRRCLPAAPHQLHEAAYLTARAAMGRRIDDTNGDLRRLVDANETVHETRQLLSWGRGNVGRDAALSGGRSSRRVDGLRAFVFALNQHSPPWQQSLAAASVVARAGNCDEHGYVGTRLHAPKLAPAESVQTRASTGFGHVWSEVHHPDGPTVVLDAWANGPAMQLPDTLWSTPGRMDRYPLAPPPPDAPVPTVAGSMTLETFAHGPQAQQARDALFQHAQVLSSGHHLARFAVAMAGTLPPSVPPACFDYLVTPPLAGSLDPGTPSFGAKSRAALAALPPVHAQVLAVHALRSAYGLSVGVAARQAPAVLDAAWRLDTMPEDETRLPPHS